MRHGLTAGQRELILYDKDRFAWSMYLGLKYAPDRETKVVLWSLLTDEQKAEVKKIKEAEK